ncbi:MAG: hypothetical protein H0V76_01755 [Blastocatellia bacterium]|nr:hypothetical protein [Blastocatellia bacterium]
MRILMAGAIISIVGMTAFGQSLSVEEIVERHLNAIGGHELRASRTNQLAIGTNSFESKLPARRTEGRSVIASDAGNHMFASTFNSQEYPSEKIGHFGGKVDMPWVTAGTRSPLGAFIKDHEKILTDGLLTGTMSMQWTIANLEKTKGRVRASGTKTVNGRRAYIIDYYPRGVSSDEFSIKLFFDVESFHHLRTEYFRMIPAKPQPFGALGVQGGVKMGLNESFSNFRMAGGMILPHSYKLDYITDSNSGTAEYHWTIDITQYMFNQKLAEDFFKF